MHRSRSVTRFAAALAVALAAAACDDGTGVEITDLTGFWNATLFVLDDDTGNHPGFGLDIISDGDGGVTLAVAEDGTFTGSLTIPEVTIDPATGETRTVDIAGSLSIIDQGRLQFDFDAATEDLPIGFLTDFTAAFVLARNVFSFTSDEVTFDFPDSFEQTFLGTTRGAVDATLEARFER